MDYFKAKWTELQTRIRALDENSNSMNLVRLLIFWLRENPDVLRSRPFSAYHFEQYLDLPESDYLVDTSTLPSREIRKIKADIDSYSFRDLNLAPQYLRDLLDILLILEVDEDCTVCGSQGLGVYASMNGRLAYECKQCGFAVYQDGSKVDSHLRIATRTELRAANLI